MKILLTGNLFHNYDQDLVAALLKMGHSVESVFNNIFGPFQLRDPPTIPKYLAFGVLPHKLGVYTFQDYSIRKYNRCLFEKISLSNYDLLLVINCRTLNAEAVESFPGPKVLWIMDSIKYYPELKDKLAWFDYVFLFEPNDLEIAVPFCRNTPKALKLGFNPEVYFPLKSPSSVSTASFVGSFWPKRERMISALLESGVDVSIYGDFYRSKSKQIRNAVISVSVSADQARYIYSSSLLNLNVHAPQNISGFSVRTFELLGSGGFQLLDRLKFVDSTFTDGIELALYGCEEELLEKAKFYLSHETLRRRIAENGYRCALQSHTWESRFSEMFKVISK